MRKNLRYLNIDIAKFICSLFIVAIHVELFKENIYVYKSFGHIEELAIPFFAVVTGYFFAQNRNAGGRYTVKFIFHIVTVYIIWITVDYLFVTTRAQYLAGYVYFNARAFFLDHFTIGKFWYFGSIILFVALYECGLKLKEKISAKAYLVVVCTATLMLIIVMELTSGYSSIINPNPIYMFFHRYEITGLIRRIILYALPIMILGSLVYNWWDEILIIRKRRKELFVIGAVLYCLESIISDIYKFDCRTMVPYVLIVSFFIILISSKGKEKKNGLNISGWFRCMSGFIYCMHTIPIYYIQSMNQRQEYLGNYTWIGRYSWIQLLFSVMISIIIGTMLFFMVKEKRMRKIIA